MAKRRLQRRVVALVALASVVLASVAAVSLRAAHVQLPGMGAIRPASSSGWTTRGPDILRPDGKPFVIAGVTWYGIETPQHTLFGLDTRDYKTILNQSKSYRFNTLRIPFSNEAWETNLTPRPHLVR